MATDDVTDAKSLKSAAKLPSGFEYFPEPIQYENIAPAGVAYRNTPALWDRWVDIRGPEPTECIYALGSDHHWLATEVESVNGSVKFLPLLHPTTSSPLFRRKNSSTEAFPPPPAEHGAQTPDTVTNFKKSLRQTHISPPPPAKTEDGAKTSDKAEPELSSSDSANVRRQSKRKMGLNINISEAESSTAPSRKNEWYGLCTLIVRYCNVA